MKSKSGSLMIIAAIYVFAAAAGALTAYLLYGLIKSPVLLLFIADCAATVIVFIFSLILDNASVYDPYWSVAPVFLALGYYLTAGAAFSSVHFFVLIPLSFWAVRLTFNWTLNFENLKWVDWRYTKYKEQHPLLYPLISFTGIMLMPTVLVFAGMIPFYYMLTAANTGFIFPLAGSLTILFAATYQATADAQMRSFRRRKAEAANSREQSSENGQNSPNISGGCIDSGLWRYCRHPNYFGEIMVWWGMMLTSLYNFNPLSLAGAVLITCLFFFVSVPMMEKRLLKSRPAYKDYRRTVISPIIPFFRRNGAAETDTN